jgi:hypothetical protein
VIIFPIFPVAVRAGFPLKIAAKIEERVYWEEKVKPLIERHNHLVQYIG